MLRATSIVVKIIALTSLVVTSVETLSLSELQENYVVVRKRAECIPPYERVGKQCLFFSRPHPPWGISDTWEEAYKSFYNAAIFCMERGGNLATGVSDFESAKKHCLEIRGSCAPSLVAREGRCLQWSPLDGSELEVPCNVAELKARFICEQDQ